MLEASLGYYINPLINVMLGMLLLKERLRPLQWLAVALASLGVAQQVWQLGSLPGGASCARIRSASSCWPPADC